LIWRREGHAPSPLPSLCAKNAAPVLQALIDAGPGDMPLIGLHCSNCGSLRLTG